jgi:hypothetical protein
MRIKLNLMLLCVLVGGFAAIEVHAQKGVGDSIGIAQQAIKPEVVSLSGSVKAIMIEPCEMTKGRSTKGTHILLETAVGDQQNIHLGPTASVSHVADKLVVGQTVTVQAFRTDALPKDNFVAQALKIGDETLQLRDENLRPMWAGDRAERKGRGKSQRGVGNQRGPGQGNGAAYGRGRGQARNVADGQGCAQCRKAGYGQKQGQGRGAAMAQGRTGGKGQGRGAGYGQGRGQGRGQSWNGPCGSGRGQCRNVAFSQGRGGGRGQGMGQGQGQGRGKGRANGKGRGQGQGFGRGQCTLCEQQLGEIIDSLPQSDLSEKERQGLLLMREEEKLAHDVYVTLGKKWELRPLANIPQAESRHMDFVKILLDRYEVADPIDDLTVGKFASQPMQQLYDQLVTQGEKSVEEAIKVGALIEELDIADLRRLIDEADNSDIKVVYQNLLKGSRNHLRAFARQLGRYSTTYSTKHLSQNEFDRIASSDHERGVMISDPSFKF